MDFFFVNFEIVTKSWFSEAQNISKERQRFFTRVSEAKRYQTLAAGTSEGWKRLDGSELDGSEHFERNCQNVPGAAGASPASAACIYYIIIGGHPNEYTIKGIWQKQ